MSPQERIAQALEELEIRLEATEEISYLSDEDRKRARRYLEDAGLSLDQVERGGVAYALRKSIEIVKNAMEESGDEIPPL